MEVAADSRNRWWLTKSSGGGIVGAGGIAGSSGIAGGGVIGAGGCSKFTPSIGAGGTSGGLEITGPSSVVVLIP